MIPRLGVNIDHVATLRQARGEFYPEVHKAAEVSLKAGAHQITIHLREDRRHIQDSDLPQVHQWTQKYKRPLNLEMGCAEEMLGIALKLSPEWVCLVPEKREERTTEGGLDLITENNFKKVRDICQRIKEYNSEIKISLFIESSEDIIKRAISLEGCIDAVEIHTGDYAKAFLENKDLSSYLSEYKKAHEDLKGFPINYHAGHGLTLESVVPLLELGLFEEYNIGHSIISESVFKGLSQVVEEYLELFKKYPLE